MTWTPSEAEITEQKVKVFGPEPYAKLLRPCRIDDGILSFDEEQKKTLIKTFDREVNSLAFFVPASGSGSRMLQFLFEYRNCEEPKMCGQMEQFISCLNEFSFFRKLPEHIQQSVKDRNFEINDLLDAILNEKGLGLGKIPKGLIPFHQFGPFVLTPFQEHLIQGDEVSRIKKPSFHFTIQKEFEKEIDKIVKNTTEMTGVSYQVSFSEQAQETNSVAFKDSGEILKNSDNTIVTRPSGHGALLPILNKINEELVFIKNIDNVQHFSKSEESKQTWKMLGGLLIEFKRMAIDLFQNPTIEGLKQLNNKFQFIDDAEIALFTDAESIKKLIDRPTRVCGMVKNEGLPGGGPFWINNNGIPSKQIVEKAQISDTPDQRNILLKSTHFNPVMIAACPISLEGKKFDLLNFRDNEAYFIVHKSHEGNGIRYLEQPGLWNGSMANWNTIFVEIPNTVFSPVKTVLDLLDPAHRES
jgi:hypothetical protein